MKISPNKYSFLQVVMIRRGDLKNTESIFDYLNGVFTSDVARMDPYSGIVGDEDATMRVCHMWEGARKISFGIYACSPEDSSFKAVFTDMRITECAWKAHDGQQPD